MNKFRHENRPTSCAACKFLKRKCSPNCIFAPHFRSHELNKFAKVHKVFGASNVSKLLGEVPLERREDTVNSLVFEAESRLKDPVYGCMRPLAMLQRRMVQLQHDLAISRAHLASFSTNPNSNLLPSNNHYNNNSNSYYADFSPFTDEFVVCDEDGTSGSSNTAVDSGSHHAATVPATNSSEWHQQNGFCSSSSSYAPLIPRSSFPQ